MKFSIFPPFITVFMTCQLLTFFSFEYAFVWWNWKKRNGKLWEKRFDWFRRTI